MNLVFMIDSMLNKPLFLHDVSGKVISNILNVNWYAEENRTFTVFSDFFIKINKATYQSQSASSQKGPSIEVKMMDFNQFETLFWNKYKNKKSFKNDSNHLNALTVWSEIMSYIKGSPNTYLHRNWILEREDYLKCVGEHKTFISKETKLMIWDIAQKYEEWKTKENYFDLMDVVAYLISEILHVAFIFNLFICFFFQFFFSNYIFKGTT